MADLRDSPRRWHLEQCLNCQLPTKGYSCFGCQGITGDMLRAVLGGIRTHKTALTYDNLKKLAVRLVIAEETMREIASSDNHKQAVELAEGYLASPDLYLT